MCATSLSTIFLKNRGWSENPVEADTIFQHVNKTWMWSTSSITRNTFKKVFQPKSEFRVSKKSVLSQVQTTASAGGKINVTVASRIVFLALEHLHLFFTPYHSYRQGTNRKGFRGTEQLDL